MTDHKAPSTTDEERWFSYKDLITKLYIQEDTPLSEVLKILKNDYKFPVTKAQLERHFKLWNLKKNSTKEDWQVIVTKVKKRKREGKESDVYIHGKPVNHKRICQEMSRYRSVTDANASDVVSISIPSTPDGVQISTPGGNQISTPSGHMAQSSHTRLPSYSLMHNLLDQTESGGWKNFSHYAAANAQNTDSRQLLRRFTDVYCALEDENEPSLSIGTIRLFSETTQPQTGLSDKNKALAINSHAFSYICALLFYLSNKLHPELDCVTHYIHPLLNAIKPRDMHRFLATLWSMKNPSAEAVLEQLFHYSIANEDIEITGMLLNLGTDPNQPLSFDGMCESPLNYAIECRNMGIIQLLIDHGADIDGRASLEHYAIRTPLAEAVSGRFSDMVSWLTNRRVNLNGISGKNEKSVLHFAGCDVKITRMLLDAGVDAHHLDRFGENCLQAAFNAYDEYKIIYGDDEYECIKQITDIYLEKGLDLNYCFESGEPVLNIAVRDRHLGLIKFLVSRGAKATDRTMSYAVHSGDLMVVEFLESIGVSLRSIVLSSRLLACTIFEKRFRMAKWLLAKGARVNPEFGIDADYEPASDDHYETASDDNYEATLIDSIDIRTNLEHALDSLTPLQAACVADRLDLVRELIERGASINAPPHEGAWNLKAGTALTAAVVNNNLDMVNMLLEGGAGVESISNPNFPGGLILAVEAGNIEIVKRLLNVGLGAHEEGMFETLALSAAIRTGNKDMTALFQTSDLYLNPQIKTFAKYQTPVVEAIFKGYVGLATDLLEAGADINNSLEVTALAAAVRSRSVQLVKQCVAFGADTNDPQALREAVKGIHNLEIVELLSAAHLQQYGRLRDKFGCLAMDFTANKKNPGIFRHLMGIGLRFRKSTTNDHTKSLECGGQALNNAIYSERSEMIGLLLDAGADPSLPAVDQFSRTALQSAADYGNIAIVEQLLEAGCDVNENPATEYGVTALQAAAIEGNIGLAKLLISRGAQVNATGARKDGRTALEGAAEHGRIDMLQLLLDSGAEVHGSGQSQYERAIGFAKAECHFAAARMLEKYHQATLPDQTTGDASYQPSQNGRPTAASPKLAHKTQEQPVTNNMITRQPMPNPLLGIDDLFPDLALLPHVEIDSGFVFEMD